LEIGIKFRKDKGGAPVSLARNLAAAEKSESESEGGQKFLPPQPPSFLPARAFSFCRAKRGNQSGFRSKKVRASFSNCDNKNDLYIQR